jgi:hypothetical protein
MNTYTNNIINYAFRVTPLTEEEKLYVINNYSSGNAADLKETLTTKKVRPVVGKMMVGLGVDVDYWQKEYDFFLNRNKAVIEEIDYIFGELRKKGVTNIIAYENFGALLSSGTDTALYSSGDVDLFADVSQKETIVKVMKSLGYKPTLDFHHERNIMTEFLKENGIIRVNIDWIILRRMMFPINVSLDGVLDWGSLRHYSNTNIQLPSKEALLYLCLLRIAVHGFSRSPDVRLYIDIQNCACVNPDWEQVIKWAKRDNVLTKVVAVAYISHQLNGVAVPDDVLRIAEQDKYAQLIIAKCYDFENRTLRYDPSGMELLRVEAASDSRSLAGEILAMFFPPKKWLAAFYQKDGDACYKKYVNYYKRMIGK